MARRGARSRNRQVREQDRAVPERHQDGRYRTLETPFEPLRVMSDDQVEHLHEQAIQYLADEGIKVLLDEACDIYEQAGCSVVREGAGQGAMVRLDPDVIRAGLGSAPTEIDIVPRNPERTMHVGGRSINLLPVGGPPFVSDLDRGRREGTIEDQRNFLKLTQSFDVMAAASPSVEPSDVPVNVRHLESMRATLTLTDKVPFLFSRGRRRVDDMLEMIRIVHGVSEQEFGDQFRCRTNINTNSPRQIDVPMSLGIIDFARANQPCIMTPFTLAGAMAPVTLAGALVLQHIEVLAAVTLSQSVRAGAPVVYGAFTSNVDMRSGSPAFGTPEAFKAALASGQLARHVGLPWRSSGSSASTSVDAQGAYETMLNTWGAVLGGANWVMHTAGWQEGGLVASYEKFIADIEMCQMIAESCQPLDTGPEALALDAITQVGPGGHFFGAAHTLERFETAFYDPLVFSRSTFEQWHEEGRQRTDQRANKIYKQVLADYEPPPLDDAIVAELDDFVARRRSEGGAAPE